MSTGGTGTNVPAGAQVVAYDTLTGGPVFLQLADRNPLGRQIAIDSSHSHAVQNPQLLAVPCYGAAAVGSAELFGGRTTAILTAKSEQWRWRYLKF